MLIVKLIGRLGKPLYLMYIITSWINLKFPFKSWFEIKSYFLFAISNFLFLLFLIIEILAELFKISLNIYKLRNCYDHDKN